MARKRQPRGERPGRKPRGDQPPLPPDLPDPRAHERSFHELLGDQAAPDTPQGRAEDLLAQAFAQRDPRRRADLARRALSLWPDCADAFVLLAENAASRSQALDLYRQG